MDIAWGEPEKGDTQGLDIVGVRALDQGLEAALANGITTISNRGRYFTILTWAIGEFFSNDMDRGAEAFDEPRFKAFLSRVEFLTLACTALDPGKGDPGGALGSTLYSEEVKALRSGQPVKFPTGRSGAMLGAYFGPCRAIGLMRLGDGNQTAPFVLTPRGKQVWEARGVTMGEGPWRALLWDADIVKPEQVRDLAQHFSLKSMAHAPAEATALQGALLTPWAPDGPAAEGVSRAYERFGQTVDWLQRMTEAGTALRDNALLGSALLRVVDGQTNQRIDVSWAEFEWRRRVHFALELVLSAVSGTVRDLREATIDEVIEDWIAQPELSERLMVWWPAAASAHTYTAEQAIASVPPRLFLDETPPGDIASLGPYGRALAAFAILVCMTKNTGALRAAGQFRRRESPGDWVMTVVESAGGEPFPDLLKAIAGIVVKAHLATTFRKMGNRQKCSLRFFPEGSRLLTTDEPTGAGRSGSRLGNVIKILEDAGVPGFGAAG